MFVEADCPAATNAFQITDPLVSSLSGTNVPLIIKQYEGLRDDIKACISVPMTNAPADLQKQYVRDALSSQQQSDVKAAVPAAGWGMNDSVRDGRRYNEAAD